MTDLPWMVNLVIGFSSPKLTLKNPIYSVYLWLLVIMVLSRLVTKLIFAYRVSILNFRSDKDAYAKDTDMVRTTRNRFLDRVVADIWLNVVVYGCRR